MNGRLTYLRQHHGAALLAAFLSDPRSEPFEDWLRGDDGSPLDKEAAETALFQRYREADPTPTGACTQWLLRQAMAGNMPAEDLGKARETLEAFLAYKSRLPPEKRDLGRHDSLGSVWQAIEPFVRENAAHSAREEERREREAVRGETEMLLDASDPDSLGWTVLIPKTERASKWWGRGTRWCTASTFGNMFDQYNSTAPLVIFIRPDGKKFQFHAQTGSFMDAADSKAGRDALTGIWPVLKQRLPGLALAIHPKGGEQITADRSEKTVGGLHRFFEKMMGLDAAHKNETERNDWRSAIGDFGLSFSKVPDRFLDESIYEAAVARNGKVLAEIRSSHRTYAICLAAVRSSGAAIRHVPQEHRDRTMHLAAVRQGELRLDQVPLEHRDFEVCLTAVRKSGGDLIDVPKNLRDREICLAALEQDGSLLAEVPVALRDREICLAAVLSPIYQHHRRGVALSHVPDAVKDREICLAALKTDGNHFHLVPKSVIDREMCEIAVRSKGAMLKHVPEAWRDEALCRSAFAADAIAITHIPSSLITRDIAMSAVTHTPSLIEFVPEHLKDIEFCRAAVARNINVFAWLPAERIDQDLAEEVVGKVVNQIVHVPDHAMSAAICDIVIREQPSSVLDLPPAWLTEDVLRRAVEKHVQVFTKIPERQRSPDVCVAACRQRKDMMEKVPKRLLAEVRRMLDLAPEAVAAQERGDALKSMIARLHHNAMERLAEAREDRIPSIPLDEEEAAMPTPQ